jgi:hypothetical protein
MISKAVNLPHAVERAVERGVFETSEADADGLRVLTEQISKNGFPSNAILDSANINRVLVPIGNAGMAVYQVAKKRDGQTQNRLKCNRRPIGYIYDERKNDFNDK